MQSDHVGALFELVQAVLLHVYVRLLAHSLHFGLLDLLDGVQFAILLRGGLVYDGEVASADMA